MKTLDEPLTMKCAAVIAGLALAVTACSSATDEPAEPVARGASLPSVPWETFRASATRIDTGAYVVEGDLFLLNEERLRHYWETTIEGGSGQALTVFQRTLNGAQVDDVWPFPARLDITYCVRTTFTPSQWSAVLAALEAAGKAWSRVAGVGFRRVNPFGTCNASNSEVLFDVQPHSGGPFFGLGPPPSTPRAERTLTVDDTAFTTTLEGRTLEGILTHELGHMLGFAHEHVWTGCTGETPDGKRLVTEQYEMDSVMFNVGCRSPAGGGYHITNLDNTGAVSVYGLAPALIQVLTSP